MKTKNKKSPTLLETIREAAKAARARRAKLPFLIGADNDWEARRTSYKPPS